MLLHGFCESHAIFSSLLPDLAKDRRVIAPNLPGHGGTPWLKSLKSTAHAAQWVFSFLDALGIEAFELLGHSMGGYVAAAMGASQPKRIKHLTLLHTTTLGDTEGKVAERNKAIRFVEQHGKEPFLKAFIDKLFVEPREEWIGELRRITAETDQEAVIGFLRIMRDRPAQLHALKNSGIPAAYVTGALDEIVSPARNEEELLNWPEAESVWFPEAGHMSMYESNEALLHFIQTKSS